MSHLGTVEHFTKSDAGRAPGLASVAEGALRQVIPADTALSLPTRGTAPQAPSRGWSLARRRAAPAGTPQPGAGGGG